MGEYCNHNDLLDHASEDLLQSKLSFNKETDVYDPGIETSAIQKASGIAESYFAARYRTPLDAIDDGVRFHVAAVAVYIMASKCGYKKKSEDDNFFANYEKALDFFKDVQSGKARITATEKTSGSAPGKMKTIVSARDKIY